MSDADNRLYPYKKKYKPKKFIDVIAFIRNIDCERFFIRGFAGKFIVPPDEVLATTNWRKFLKFHAVQAGNHGMEIEFYSSRFESTLLFIVGYHINNGWGIRKEGIIINSSDSRVRRSGD